jgi:hypothetical protein
MSGVRYMSSARQEADMMQAVARRFRHWFNHRQASPAPTEQEEQLPSAVPVPAPQPVGLEDTAPVDIERILPSGRSTPPPMPVPPSSRTADAGVVAKPVQEVSDWSAIIAAAKRRCDSSGPT